MGTALGLGYLHDQGIPHADLRGVRMYRILNFLNSNTILQPNILLDDQGEALLSDYGTQVSAINRLALILFQF